MGTEITPTDSDFKHKCYMMADFVTCMVNM